MKGFTKIERGTLRAYWVSAVIIMAIALLGAATIIYRDYKDRLRDAGQQVMYLAQTLAEHTTQIFVKLDALSRAIVEDSTDRIVDENLLSEFMRRRAAAEPAAMGIAIVDKGGRVRASGTNNYPIGKDLRTTTDFRVLSSATAPDFYISKPYQLDLSVPGEYNGWTMNYARRMTDSFGRFNGFALIVVDEAYLYGFYNRVVGAPDMTLGLIGSDGIIRASNAPEVIGRNVENNLGDQIWLRKGIQILPSLGNGAERIFAHYPSSAAPLIAYVGIPVAPIYRSWLIASSLIIAALAALCAALITLGVVWGRYIQNRTSLMRSMVETTQQRREKEFLETIVNTGDVLMAVTDSIGHPVVVNRAMQELFPETDFITTDKCSMSRVLGEPFEKITDTLPWKEVREVTLQSGRKHALSWAVSPIVDKNDNVANLVVIGLDITERREAELAIYQSSKLVTLGEMATGIAHEINQPLATLAMAVDNIQADIESGRTTLPAVLLNLALISNQIDRAANIVNHMRIYGHRRGEGLKPVDPTDAIDGALALARAQITAYGIEIKCEYFKGQYLVYADLLLVEQILLNLLLNARDAILEKIGTESGEGQLVLVRLFNGESNMVGISVSDTGSGLSEEIKGRLFEPFFSTKPVGKGTGLGLSLSHGMARDMGGQLIVVDVSEGAEFQLFLRDASPGILVGKNNDQYSNSSSQR